MKELFIKAINSKRFVNQDTLRGTFRDCGHRITPKRIWMEGHQITWMKDGKKLFSEMVCQYAAWTYIYVLTKKPDFIPDRRFHQILELYSITELPAKNYDLFYERINEDKNEIKEYRQMGHLSFKLKKYYQEQIKELEQREERTKKRNEYMEGLNKGGMEEGGFNDVSSLKLQFLEERGININ